MLGIVACTWPKSHDISLYIFIKLWSSCLIDWLRPCVDSIIQGFSQPVMKVGRIRLDSHHSSGHVPLTLHSRHGQILMHSHCSLRSRSALASVTSVSLVKKDVRLLCVRFDSYCNCFRRWTGPWSMFTPAVTLRSRSNHALHKISFDWIVTGAWVERERSVTASVNASIGIH